MKKLAAFPLLLTVLLSACSSPSSSTPAAADAATSSAETSSASTDQSTSDPATLTAQANGVCAVPPGQPRFAPFNGRITAQSIAFCHSLGIITGDIVYNIVKSPSTTTGSRTIPFASNLVTAIVPKPISVDAPCTSGLYYTQTKVFTVNMAKGPTQSGRSPEYDIYCRDVNQFNNPVNDIAAGIADHSWNATNGGSGHASQFPAVGIRSQAQLQLYVRNLIVNRHAPGSRTMTLDTCTNGRIALYDPSKRVFMIYNPIVNYFGSVYPAGLASFSC